MTSRKENYSSINLAFQSIVMAEEGGRLSWRSSPFFCVPTLGAGGARKMGREGILSNYHLNYVAYGS